MSLVTPRKGYKIVRLFPRLTDELIPEEWEIDSVDSLLKIIDYRGRTPPFSKEGIIHLRSNNIRKNKINFNEITFVTKETYDKYMTRGIPKENDVLFTTEGPLGESTTVPNNFIFSLAQRIIVLRPKNLKLNSKFLKFLLDSKIIKKRYEGLSTGTTLGGISSKWFTKLLLTFPSNIEEQQKIATILSNVDNLIESTGKVITHSKKVKTGLMQKLLTRGIGHTKFKKVLWMFGKEIEIPQEWEVEKFRNKIKMEYGSGLTEDKRDNLKNPVYGSGGLIGLHSKPNVNGPGIIVARKGSLGNVFFENNDFFPIDTVYYITHKETEFHLKFLFYYLLHLKLEYLRIVTSKPGISREDVYSYRILSIPLSEQQKIALILSTVDSQIESQIQYKEKLLRLKKSLMQKLLTGEVRVKV